MPFPKLLFKVIPLNQQMLKTASHNCPLYPPMGDLTTTLSPPPGGLGGFCKVRKSNHYHSIYNLFLIKGITGLLFNYTNALFYTLHKTLKIYCFELILPAVLTSIGSMPSLYAGESGLKVKSPFSRSANFGSANTVPSRGSSGTVSIVE